MDIICNYYVTQTTSSRLITLCYYKLSYNILDPLNPIVTKVIRTGPHILKIFDWRKTLLTCLKCT